MLVVDETESSKSLVFVPLISRNLVVGAISLQNVDREYAFSESDIRLLQTLANSTSVSLENARLFNETQRLLSETQSRNAELAMINAIQQGLVAQLDMDAIYTLVGDKISGIFKDADAVIIEDIDAENKILYQNYVLEKGKRYYIEPETYAGKCDEGFYDELSVLKDVIALNEDANAWFEARGCVVFEDTLPPKSAVIVPILVGNKTRGNIQLQNVEREGAFGPSEVQLLTTLASSTGIALENARLFKETQILLEETRQRAAELATVNQISTAVGAQLELEKLVSLVGEQIRETFAADICYVALYDRGTETIRFPYTYGDQLPDIPFGEGLTSRIISTCEPLLINQDVDTQRKALGATKVGTDVLSYLGVPIASAGEAIGVLSVQSARVEGRFDDDDVRLLTTIAANVGTAIQNARLYREIQRRAVEMAALAEIGSDIASTHELEPVLDRLAVRVKELLQIRDIAFYLISDDGSMLVPVAALGKYIVETMQSKIKVGTGITGWIASTGVAEIINYPQKHPQVVHIPGTPVDDEEDEIMMCAPLISRGKVIGTINAWRERLNGLFVQQDLDFLVSVARQAAIAIESARLYMETVNRADQMATVAELGREMTSSLDLSSVLEHMAERLHAIFNAQDTVIRLLEPDGETFKAVVALGDYAENFKASTVRLGMGISGTIAASGTAEIVNDPSHDPRGVHVSGTPEEETEITSLMVAPLISQGRPIGLILLYRLMREGAFSLVDLDFLVALARQAASAVENARLFDETQRRALETLATSEILRIISSSPGDLEPVLKAVAQKAVEICDAEDALILLKEGGVMIPVSGYGSLPLVGPGEPVKNQIPLDRQTVGGRAILDQSVVHVEDIFAESEVEYEAAKQMNLPLNIHTLLAAPLLAKGEAIGSILLRRDHVEAFTDRQIDLLKTFADQAVIAIENARHIEEIQRRREYFETLVSNMPAAIVTFDLDANITGWNPGAEKLFGYTAAEAIGQNIDRLIANDDRFREEAETYSKMGMSGMGVHHISQRMRKDKTLVDIELSGVPVFVAGQKLGMIGIYHDISDVMRARREAEEANQAKSAFLAMMSHEIRTPMNAIIGMSGLLLDTPLNLEQQEFAMIIRDSGDTLLAIINDILDFSKIEAGKMELECHPFDLRECVESALDLIAPRAAEKRLDLAYTIEDRRPTHPGRRCHPPAPGIN